MWTMNFILMHCLQYHVISSDDGGLSRVWQTLLIVVL